MKKKNFDEPVAYDLEEAFARLLTYKPKKAKQVLETMNDMALTIGGL